MMQNINMCMVAALLAGYLLGQEMQKRKEGYVGGCSKCAI